MSKSGLLFVALSCSVLPAAHAAEVGSAAKATSGETRTLPGGALLTFSADAKYELGKAIRLQLAPAGHDKTTVQVIKLSAGRVSITIPASKNPKTAVLVQAPRKVSALAKGGESLVITASERVTVAAVSGEMLAASGNDWKPLPSGLVRSFGVGAASEQRVPETPALSATSSMLLALDGNVSTNLKIAPSANVAYRQLVLYRIEGSKRTKLSDADFREDSRQLSNLAPGRYEARVRAVDRFGVESPASTLTLRVIGAELPEGSRLVGDSILLGRSGRVKLIGAEGLESSYGRVNMFVPAPKDVGLTRGQSTFLRLREPGGSQELAIKLEPRTLRADVAIGPKTARWPGEPLQVQVKLFDHSGKPVTDALKTKPRVFVNVDAVEPVWTHAGNTYTAKVAPRPGAGPWVVRVEVNDDFGDQVGRDFIELGGS